MPFILLGEVGIDSLTAGFVNSITLGLGKMKFWKEMEHEVVNNKCF